MNNTIGNIYNPIQPSSPYSIFTSGFNYSGNSTSDYQKPHYDIIKVNGKNGAEKLDMGPNSAVLLLDMNDPIVWFVQTDGAGYKTCLPYSITAYQPPQELDVQSVLTQLSNRLTKIEERIEQNESNNAVIKQQPVSQQPAIRTEFNL